MNMDIRYVHKPASAFIGFTRIVDPRRSSVECSEFWNECFTERYGHLFRGSEPSDENEKAMVFNEIGRYGLCISTCNDNMNYMIAGEYTGGDIPQDMKVYRVPEGDWAVFSERGTVPEVIPRMNQYIWNEWYPEKGILCNPCGDAMVEHYEWSDDETNIGCEIWVQVMNIPDAD